MSANFSVDKRTGMAYAHILLSSQRASTFHSERIILRESVIAEKEFFPGFSPDLTPTGNDFEDDEEREWDILFAQPHVQAGLSRLAEEAERQFAIGETEEGGFGVE